MVSIFHSMRLCGVLLDFDANILDVNNTAVGFYKAKTANQIMNYHAFDFAVNRDKAKYLLNKIISQQEVSDQEILLRRFDNTIAGVNMCAFVLPDKTKSIFVQFNETVERDTHHQSAPFDIALLGEIQRLKPYLNKAGQNLLQTISDKHKFKHNNIYNERMSRIVQLYPELSASETNLCVCISLNIPTSEISRILGKTPNAIRVSIHRIEKKLHKTSRTELFKTIAAIY